MVLWCRLLWSVHGMLVWSGLCIYLLGVYYWVLLLLWTVQLTIWSTNLYSICKMVWWYGTLKWRFLASPCTMFAVSIQVANLRLNEDTYPGIPFSISDRSPTLSIIGILQHVLRDVLIRRVSPPGGYAAQLSSCEVVDRQVLVVGALFWCPSAGSFTSIVS